MQHAERNEEFEAALARHIPEREHERVRDAARRLAESGAGIVEGALQGRLDREDLERLPAALEERLRESLHARGLSERRIGDANPEDTVAAIEAMVESFEQAARK